jgi:hypothetical protein
MVRLGSSPSQNSCHFRYAKSKLKFAGLCPADSESSGLLGGLDSDVTKSVCQAVTKSVCQASSAMFVQSL